MQDATTTTRRPRAAHGDGLATRLAWLAPVVVALCAVTVVVLAGWFQ